MYSSRSITKHFLAFGGAWLTLAAGLQQSGSLCRLVNCGCDATESHAEAEDHAVCSHHHGDHVHRRQVVHLESDNRDDAAGRADGPCEHDCWCCQPPAPQQQPTSLDADALTQPTANGAGVVIAAIKDSAWSVSASNFISAPERAVDACARLCRFLA